MQKSFFVPAALSLLVISAGMLLSLGVSAGSSQASAPYAASPLEPNTGASAAAAAAPTAASTSAAAVPTAAVVVPPKAVAPSAHARSSGAVIAKAVPVSAQPPDYPKQLVIPSIGLSDAIVPVGLTSGGAMAVPSGKSSDVGWYKFGALPGAAGNAVIDAHVFAAFSNLHAVAAGDEVSVVTVSGKRLRFVVTDVEVYPYASVPTAALFGPTDERHLNLITCYGNLTADRSTYDRRLVVYATLAG